MLIQELLSCPQHNAQVSQADDGGSYRCLAGCLFPIVNDIPRFVSPENYASSFGLQWNTFRRTQLDSHTGVTISRDRLMRLAGGNLNIFYRKDVLEAGCGAGRFTEIMLSSGARVFATDISEAVEANYLNCRHFEDYFVCQADISQLPVQPACFDIVVCIGVIQHTPNPEATISALCKYLKPGGLLIIDHYTRHAPSRTRFRAFVRSLLPTEVIRQLIRAILLGRSQTFSMKFCQSLVTVLWPVHRMSWKLTNLPGLRNVSLLRDLRRLLLSFSPIMDHQESCPELRADLLFEWSLLDTHDYLVDHFKQFRSREQIASHLVTCGMIDIDVAYAGNGVEARARAPSGKYGRDALCANPHQES